MRRSGEKSAVRAARVHAAGRRRLARRRQAGVRAAAAAAATAVCLALAGCGTFGGAAQVEEIAGGAPFAVPASLEMPAVSAAVPQEGESAIDASHVARGYVVARAVSDHRLKFQVVCGDGVYNYDLPNTGEAIVCPINMGEGDYNFRVMQNTSGNDYVETASEQATVALESEFEPFLRPNVYCDYDEDSACVALARQLAADAGTQGEALAAVCDYIVDNVRYDATKAAQLADATGYVPTPDSTLSTCTGICFDYASLGAAMLRSLGIPAKIVTGNVSPDDIYHAWIMVYVDGTWQNAQFDVQGNTWERLDLTFAAGSAPDALVGDGKTYTDRYTY